MDRHRSIFGLLLLLLLLLEVIGSLESRSEFPVPVSSVAVFGAGLVSTSSTVSTSASWHQHSGAGHGGSHGAHWPPCQHQKETNMKLRQLYVEIIADNCSMNPRSRFTVTARTRMAINALQFIASVAEYIASKDVVEKNSDPICETTKRQLENGRDRNGRINWSVLSS